MSIHTIGDSHCYNGWSGTIPHYLGAMLCYSFGKEKLDRCDIRNFDIKDGDTILFCFGEIDCRCHVYKHVNESTTYQDVIDNIVNNYFDAIELNLITANIQLKHVCVYNVVPPARNPAFNPYFPYLGTDEERKQYVLYFNQKVKQGCLARGFVFFDVYDKYADEYGFLKRELSDGDVHIGNGTHLTEFIHEHLS